MTALNNLVFPLTEKFKFFSGQQSSGDRARTHGMSKTAIYSIWDSMIQRCYNKNRRDYKTYGAKGIKVCDKWKNDFVAFFNDMGHRPDGMSLDRIDTTKEYSPENCRWASSKIQSRNRTDNKMISFNGKTMCLQSWSEEIGINKNTLYARFLRGWDAKRSLTEPVATIYSHQKNKKQFKEQK